MSKKYLFVLLIWILVILISVVYFQYDKTTVEYDDLVMRDGIYYEKGLWYLPSASEPFTGKVKGEYLGWNGKKAGTLNVTVKNGRKEGFLVMTHLYGELYYLVEYKNGFQEGPFARY